jgi:hypothetical protein
VKLVKVRPLHFWTIAAAAGAGGVAGAWIAAEQGAPPEVVGGLAAGVCGATAAAALRARLFDTERGSK